MSVSTYSSDGELGDPRILDGVAAPLPFVDVASSFVETDVRLILGDAEFFMDPAVADQLAAALTRQAAEARRKHKPL